MQVATKALPIVTLLSGLSHYFGKGYCYPSQPKIIELLGSRFKMFISIATLNRYLRVIEDNGYIRRQRRIGFDPVKGLMFNSTMYFLCKKGLKLLEKIGVRVYDKIKELANGLNGESKKDAQDPERPYHTNGGKSYSRFIANGGERPSIK